jgi:geranylgeranylglycerol-phosphate geranylgeranyltransferase
MKLFQIIFILLNYINVISLKNLFILKNINKKNVVFLNKKYETKEIENNKIEKENNKIQYLFQLIRPNNIIPTTLLSFSGGWIMNPSINNLLHSTPFIISIINTVLIMSSSMVLNDIYDLEIDKINSTDRPLVTGKITKLEAFLFAISLLGSTEYLTFIYLPDNLKFIIQLAIIQISIYTPILKKILFIKNISCAALVSFSLFFSGLSVSNSLTECNKNLGLLSITMSIVFFGSLCNEILLDVRDKEGDKMNNIITIPVVFGNNFALLFSSGIIFFNVILNSFSIMYLYNSLDKALLIPIIFTPLIINIYKIKKANFSEESIVNYMKYSNYPLIILLIYICKISLL